MLAGTALSAALTLVASPDASPSVLSTLEERPRSPREKIVVSVEAGFSELVAGGSERRGFYFALRLIVVPEVWLWSSTPRPASLPRRERRRLLACDLLTASSAGDLLDRMSVDARFAALGCGRHP